MFTIKNHEYDINYSTPLAWLNERFEKYGESAHFDNLDSALEFALFLGDDFLNFCDKEKNCDRR